MSQRRSDLVKLLDECHASGIQFALDGADRLRVRGRNVSPELLGRIREHKPELLEIVERFEERAAILEYDGGVSRQEAERLAWSEILTEARRSEPPRPHTDPTWPAAVADFVLLLTPDDLPAVPFRFGNGHTVVDRAKFLARIQADAWGGPTAPRARYGAIQRDLLRLHEILMQRSKAGC